MAEAIQTPAIYARLREEILGFERSPGARLTERGLETELSASRTPVRAALMRLETEGLVARNGRAWEVSPIDLDEIAQLYDFREALEGRAARMAVTAAPDADVAALRELLGDYDRDGTSDGNVRMGAEFHVELARLSGNRFIADAVGGAMTRLARARWLEVRSEESRHEAWREHREVLDRLDARDADGAERAIVEHVAATHDRLARFLDPERQRALTARGLTIVGSAESA
jgi:DNA-binding GntR family transcriptional regulator